MRPLAALLLLAAAGCDTGAALDPYAGVIEVSLADATVEGAALRLVAVEDASCADPLVTSFAKGAATRAVSVEGIDRPEAGSCMALIPPMAVVPLELGPELPGGYAVEVAHAGAVDLYTLDASGPEAVLTAVRTTTTRLAE